MRRIELSQSRVTIVDNEDFEWLSQWMWYYQREKKRNTGYAVRTDYSSQKRTILMHVEIMKRHKCWKRGKQIDHIDTCGCDNRKVNLRLATPNEQRENQTLRLDNTS